MASSNGNLSYVTGPLYREFTGYRWIPLKKASDAELWCVIWSAPEKNCWINNPNAGDSRHYHAHYDVAVMNKISMYQTPKYTRQSTKCVHKFWYAFYINIKIMGATSNILWKWFCKISVWNDTTSHNQIPTIDRIFELPKWDIYTKTLIFVIPLCHIYSVSNMSVHTLFLAHGTVIAHAQCELPDKQIQQLWCEYKYVITRCNFKNKSTKS